MSYYYPESDPHWVEADEVRYSQPGDDTKVDVLCKMLSEDWFTDLEVGCHNHFAAFDKTVRDVTIEKSKEEGFFRISFHLEEIQPAAQ